MTESRQELVSWVNSLLQLNITKVEQCGTGAIFCQIFDSIFLDVPMAKVKFDANSEYQYIANFKVLQAVLTRQGIDRGVPVERLVKCRFQDNLEFLQWAKRYWNENAPIDVEYDAVSRRKGRVGGFLGTGAPAGGGGAAPRPASRPRPSSTTGTAASNGTSTTTKPAAPRPGARPVAAARAPPAKSARVEELEGEVQELVSAVEVVESERDFYFQKLRDIEVLIQAAAEKLDEEGQAQEDGEAEGDNEDKPETSHAQLVREIQTILYTTAEGFEIPTQEADEEETF
uniref:ARAD1C08734p n=1 Tax=Blastobotrys adeninivorans TaxID=409370 RepID=A0A060T5W7_BLAAD